MHDMLNSVLSRSAAEAGCKRRLTRRPEDRLRLLMTIAASSSLTGRQRDHIKRTGHVLTDSNTGNK